MSTTIRDLQGNIIGYQDRDGTLRDKDKKKVGSINPRNGTVLDNHNEEVGFIDSDGNVIDRYRRRLGKIGSDGVVQDWHGIEVYSGSATPLLLDFTGTKTVEPEGAALDFDEMARQAAATPSEYERDVRRGPEMTPRERIKSALTQEGFASPSVVGCLAIVGAILIGGIILFAFRNPSLLGGSARTPTPRAQANATVPVESEATPVTDAKPTAATELQEATGKVNTNILNLREGPATTFEIVDRLQLDTEVQITGRLSDSVWLKVKVPSIGKEGWVSAEYIDTEANIEALPVETPPAE